MLTDREQRIVDWLRQKSKKGGWPDVMLGYQLAANAIERGDHLVWKPEPTVKAEDWVGKSNLQY